MNRFSTLICGLSLAFSSAAFATSHAPITISGDSAFTSANGVSNPTAAGTAGDPFIITGWDIDATGVTTCISVNNTSKYYEIRNSTCTNAWFGMMLESAPNGKVINSTISSLKSQDNILTGNIATGIYISNSDNMQVTDTTIQNSTGTAGANGSGAGSNGSTGATMIGLYLVTESNVTVSNLTVTNLVAGDGGNGATGGTAAAGGNGGAGGSVYGIYGVSSTITISSSTINKLTAGKGGVGGLGGAAVTFGTIGGNGGHGGLGGYAGGIYLLNSSNVTVSSTAIGTSTNKITAGSGGNGGNGGNGNFNLGGIGGNGNTAGDAFAVTIENTATATVGTGNTLTYQLAGNGGNGGTGGFGSSGFRVGGNGGNGGNALGIHFYNSTSTSQSGNTINNQTAGSGGTRGVLVSTNTNGTAGTTYTVLTN